MKTLKEQLDSMVDKEYIYNQKNYLIKSHEFNKSSGEVTINTDSNPIVFVFTCGKQKLQEFLPVDNSPIIIPNSFQPVVDQSTVVNIKEILLENIEKVKEDKGYIPQAKSINDNVKSIIELAKTEIEMAKTIAGIHNI